jgi:hypothetical protein
VPVLENKLSAAAPQHPDSDSAGDAVPADGPSEADNYVVRQESGRSAWASVAAEVAGKLGWNISQRPGDKMTKTP